tara:strand:- start:1249 stop:3087 length:1839 start_codon:yes stop_codon:yes gene_type:complete
VQQKRPNQETPIDLVEQFYKENVDLKAILEKRKARKHISGTIEKYDGEWGDAQKKHLLNRSLMGYARYHLEDLNNLTLDESIELLFKPENDLPLPTNDYFYEWTQERYDELNKTLGESQYRVEPVPPGEAWVESAFPGNVGPWDQYTSLDSYCIKQQLRQKTSIHWKLSFFLHNLLPTSRDSGASAKAAWQYLQLIYKAPFQNYKQTIKDITMDPNMLWYLNLQFSRVDNPDENFAREIQELFTVGKGPNAKFTEEDVKAFSKIFVGWGSDFLSHEVPGKILTRFAYWNHDTSDKQLSEFYGNRLIKGREGEDGANEFHELIDVIFENEEVSFYISRRLYQFFVYPEIDEEVENNIIKPMAQKFRETNYSLVETLKLLLKSNHFFDSSNYNSLIKSPIEFVYGCLKTLKLNQEDIYEQVVNQRYINGVKTRYTIPNKFKDPMSRDYYFYGRFSGFLKDQGCLFGLPPSVSGWPPYYQAPVYDLFWINSKTISNRANFSQTFEYDFSFGNDESNNSFLSIDIDYSKLIDEMEEPNKLNRVVDQFLQSFITVDIGVQQKNDLMQIILNGVNSDHYTEIYNRYKNNPNNQNKEDLNNRFKKFISRLFMMSEIHLF